MIIKNLETILLVLILGGGVIMLCEYMSKLLKIKEWLLLIILIIIVVFASFVHVHAEDIKKVSRKKFITGIASVHVEATETYPNNN